MPIFFRGDTAITSKGHIFALDMFDASVECTRGATLVTPQGPRARTLLLNAKLDTRTRCDPIVLRATAERLCRALAASGDDARVDVAIDAKRTSEGATAPLIHVRDFCAHIPSYSTVAHNEWIDVE